MGKVGKSGKGMRSNRGKGNRIKARYRQEYSREYFLERCGPVTTRFVDPSTLTSGSRLDVVAVASIPEGEDNG